MGLEAPLLSVFDPPEEGEGGVDPLSLQPTYERLAERIYPFMTVRMSHIRFLTALAVIARVCEGLEDEVAADGATPAWLVAEWYIVEGLVRRRELLSQSGRLRIPGSQKVERALRDGRRLGAAAYLKTPTVFGFTGIYKRLATGLQIVTDEAGLDSGAVELLAAWERSQQMPGFRDGVTGEGAAFSRRLSVRRGCGAAQGLHGPARRMAGIRSHRAAPRSGPGREERSGLAAREADRAGDAGTAA